MTAAIGELVPNLKPQPILQNYGIFHLFKPVYKYMSLILNFITPVLSFSLIKFTMTGHNMTVTHDWGHMGAHHQP